MYSVKGFVLWFVENALDTSNMILLATDGLVLYLYVLCNEHS